MKVIETENIDILNLTGDAREAVYNGMDTMATRELLDILKPRLTTNTGRVYRYDLLSLGPIMEMMTRGIKVDKDKANKLATDYTNKINALYGIEMVQKGKARKPMVTNAKGLVQRMASAAGLESLNINSPKQLQHFFFNLLNIPTIYKYEKGKQKISTDRKALEQIAKNYVRARFAAKLILRIRDLESAVEVLTKGLDENGRWRFSLNPAGTDTGRYSSTEHPLRVGGNIQNIDPELREIFIPDEGKALLYCDLKGAEAFGVAYLSGDEKYIEYAQTGDPHTHVAGDTYGFEHKRELADREFYNGKSYRDMSKKFLHGSSYLGKPRTLATQANTPVDLVENFQRNLFKNFPGIVSWQERTIGEIQTNEELVGPMGWTRQFWGRPNAEETWRAGIACIPQNLIAHIMGIGIYNVFTQLPEVDILANIHDAGVFQVDIDKVAYYAPLILKVMEVPVMVNGRKMVIPLDCEVGYNWGKVSKTNPRGLKKFKEEDWK